MSPPLSVVPQLGEKAVEVEERTGPSVTKKGRVALRGTTLQVELTGKTELVVGVREQAEDGFQFFNPSDQIPTVAYWAGCGGATGVGRGIALRRWAGLQASVPLELIS
jgi:hypothetical protein